MSKWVLDTCQGVKVWYSSDVIEKIKACVLKTIEKRPHSDNKVFEDILKIIEEEEK